MTLASLADQARTACSANPGIRITLTLNVDADGRVDGWHDLAGQ